MSPFFSLMTQLAVLAHALIGGVFLDFSDFAMRSLTLAGGSGGVEAMPHFDRKVFRSVFMAVFLAMAAVSAIIAVHAATDLSHPAGTPILLAGLVYLFGCFGVTAVFNVPPNEALARMDASRAQARLTGPAPCRAGRSLPARAASVRGAVDDDVPGRAVVRHATGR